MTARIVLLSLVPLIGLVSLPALAADGFITTTFGTAPHCEHPGTMSLEGGVLWFDLLALPAGVRVQRATLTAPMASVHGQCRATHVVPVGVKGAKPLTTRPPEHNCLDATAIVAAWVSKPDTNKGLRVEDAGHADLKQAVLEVSYVGALAKPGPGVADLKAVHTSGQTFLTWKEPEDIVGEDAPTWERFEKAVLDARAKRRVVYRVYASDRPISIANLGSAQLVREIPEAISCWYILAVKNTEHPGPGRKSGSPLRQGNLVLDDIVKRYHLGDDGPPMPRAMGLAVLTTREAGTRYYAVVPAVDGRESVAELKEGRNTTGAVEEKPCKFPAIIKQQTHEVDPRHTGQSPVDLYVCWLEPPLVQFPRAVEIGIPRLADLPPGSPGSRRGLYVNVATYGTTATEIGDPGWHAARQYVRGAVTLSLAEEGTLWAGQHECIGTLRGYEDGVVWNYEQRRALAATAWAIEKPDFFVDPERVYVWGQSAGFCLRDGDLFAVVMSDGHNTYRNSREGRKHMWRWGRDGIGKNWAGENHLDYLDLARFVRENPRIELPLHVVAPAYGAFPDHTLGDFGFKPWQEFLTAMMETKRAFCATWMDNGFGDTAPFVKEMVPQIRLHQSLPAFTRCSLDARPVCDDPKGEYRPGKYDQDFQRHADKVGGINLWQRWAPAGIVDERDRWAITVWLAAPGKDGRGGSPQDSATTDLTPRRCQKFMVRPGDKTAWTATATDGKVLQSGTAQADANGLVTVPGLKMGREKIRVDIRKLQHE